MLQVQLDRPLLQNRLIGAVDQVEQIGSFWQAGLDPEDGSLDPRRAQPGRAKRAQQPGPAQGDHQLFGGDPVGHRPGIIGAARPVSSLEGRVAERFDGQRRGRSQDMRRILSVSSQGCRAFVSQANLASPGYCPDWFL